MVLHRPVVLLHAQDPPAQILKKRRVEISAWSMNIQMRHTHPVRYLILVDEVEVHEHSYHDLEGLIVGKLQVVELVAKGTKTKQDEKSHLF